MSDENTTNVNENTATTIVPSAAKKRGRPLGTLVGPRPVIWVVAGIVDGKIVQEAFQAVEGASNEERENFSMEQAKTAFEAKHGDADSELLATGPHYQKMGKYQPQGASRQKETFATTGKEKLNSIVRNAIFRGWQGVACGIDDRTDGYLFSPVQQLKTAVEGEKKSAPKRTGVYTQFLEFLDESNDSEELDNQ